MITLKEQFINDIRQSPSESKFKTIEVLDTGENNEMVWECSHESMLIILSSRFDDNLHGSVPNGVTTTIQGWEIIT